MKRRLIFLLYQINQSCSRRWSQSKNPGSIWSKSRGFVTGRAGLTPGRTTKTPIFVVFLLTRRKVGYMKLKNGLYCQKNTRKSCLFSPPNTVWPAERRKTAIFADFRRIWPKYTKITPKQARNRHCTPILHRIRYYQGNSWDLLNFPTPPIFEFPLCLFSILGGIQRG